MDTEPFAWFRLAARDMLLMEALEVSLAIPSLPDDKSFLRIFQFDLTAAIRAVFLSASSWRMVWGRVRIVEVLFSVGTGPVLVCVDRGVGRCGTVIK